MNGTRDECELVGGPLDGMRILWNGDEILEIPIRNGGNAIYFRSHYKARLKDGRWAYKYSRLVYP